MKRLSVIIIVLILLLGGTSCGKSESGTTPPQNSSENGTTTLDTTPPLITNVSPSNITETTAIITWATDELATSQVEYGKTTDYGSTTPLVEELVTSHSVSLSGLEPNTTYHFKVKSKDEASNKTVSEDKTFTTLLLPDTTPPVISGVNASNITESSTSITWTTDEPATSQVEYGKTTDYGFSTPLDESLVTSHSVSLSDLEPNTTYHFKVKSKDAGSNEAIPEDCTFATTKPTKQVSGLISTDTTWASDYIYVVTGNIVIEQGVTLTIEPSVTVKFESSKAMQVDGELIARGTEAEPIVFTSNQVPPAPGDWVNIIFTDSSIDTIYDGEDSYLSGCVLQYCIVEYGGGGDSPAIKVISSSPFIDHCDIHNNASGGIYVESSAVTISGNTISNNSGSGIYVGKSTVTISGNAITGNSADNGGGILAELSTITITENTISNNSSYPSSSEYGGGGVHCINGSTVSISDNIISDNSTSGSGGGIYCRGSSDVVVSGNTITTNSAYLGGGIYCAESSSVTISNNTVSNNSGGGFRVWESTVTISGNTISGNSASNGAGINCDNATVNISDNTISYNSAWANGGGIQCNGDIAISGNSINHNSASSGGGIFFWKLSSEATISGNDIATNSAEDCGGAIYAEGGTATISRNVVSDNSAGQGAGIYGHSGTITIIHNRITSNLSSNAASGGIVIGEQSIMGINYNDIYGNTPYDVYSLKQQGTPDIDATNNWWGTIDDATIQEHIYDWNDDASLGRIIYQPIATVPIPEAP